MVTLLEKALRQDPCPRSPVWLMRQAGRYMSEYRELKAEHGFLGLCQNPRLAVEVSLQPIDFLDVDAAIIFSDILIPTSELGIEFEFAPGPRILNPISNARDVDELRDAVSVNGLSYIYEAIALLRESLESRDEERKAVIGFAGSPYTLACYLIDQGPFKHFLGTQVFAQRFPEAMDKLLALLTNLITHYLLQQLEYGADAVQIFDTWGGNLSAEDYERWSLPSIQKITSAIRATDRPCTLYVNHTYPLLKSIKKSGASAISIDSRTSISEARSVLGPDFAVQGNFDPTHLFGPIEEVIRRTKEMISNNNTTTGFVANLGHGVLPTTPPENVRAFVETIQSGT